MGDNRIPHKNFRCEDDLWAKAMAAAAWRGDVLSAVLRRHLANYVRATEKKRAEEEGSLPPRRRGVRTPS